MKDKTTMKLATRIFLLLMLGVMSCNAQAVWASKQNAGGYTLTNSGGIVHKDAPSASVTLTDLNRATTQLDWNRVSKSGAAPGDVGVVVGTTSGTIASGNDSRIVGALQKQSTNPQTITSSLNVIGNVAINGSLQSPSNVTTFIATVFTNNDTDTYSPGFAFMASGDGSIFRAVNSTFSYTVASDGIYPTIRDIFLHKFGDTFYAFFTTNYPYTSPSKIGCVKSKDLRNWTNLATPDLSSYLTGGATMIWQAGISSIDGTPYIIWNTAFQPVRNFAMAFDPVTETFGTPIEITGTFPSDKVNLYQILKIGSTYYTMGTDYATNHGGKTINPICGTSSSPFSGYQFSSTPLASDAEGGVCYKNLDGTPWLSPTGKFRAVFVRDNGASVYYADTSDYVNFTSTTTISGSGAFPFPVAGGSGLTGGFNVTVAQDLQTEQVISASDRNVTARTVSPNTFSNANTFSGALISTGDFQATSPALTYLFSSFDDNSGLFFNGSVDGKAWFPLTTTYSYVDASNLRDPSWMNIGNDIYVAYTLAYPTVTNSFKIIKTNDGKNWSTVATPSISQMAAGGQAWAPEWFYDPATGKDVIIVTGVTAAYSMKAYLLTPTSADYSTWSTATEITGTGFPNKVIDAFPVYQNGHYFLFYSDNDGNYPQIASSSSLVSGYTTTSGNWSGWGTGYEGHSVVQLPSGIWRWYMAHSTTLSAKIWYSESSGADLATATWSTPVPTTGQDIGFVNHSNHGTIRPVNSLLTEQIVSALERGIMARRNGGNNWTGVNTFSGPVNILTLTVSTISGNMTITGDNTYTGNTVFTGNQLCVQDSNNGIFSSTGQRMTIKSYWGLDIRGFGWGGTPTLHGGTLTDSAVTIYGPYASDKMIEFRSFGGETYLGAIHTDSSYEFASGAKLHSGSGSPESVVSGTNNTSYYIDATATGTQSWYVRPAGLGTGNTGWVIASSGGGSVASGTTLSGSVVTSDTFFETKYPSATLSTTVSPLTMTYSPVSYAPPASGDDGNVLLSVDFSKNISYSVGAVTNSTLVVTSSNTFNTSKVPFSPKVPFFYVQANVANFGGAEIFALGVSDESDTHQVSLQYNPTTHVHNWYVNATGSAVLNINPETTDLGSAPVQMRLVFADRAVSAFYSHDGKTWILFKTLDLRTYMDIRDPAVLKRVCRHLVFLYFPSFGDAAVLTRFSAGYSRGIGTANLAMINFEDGTPMIVNNKQYFLANDAYVSAGLPIETSTAGIYSVDQSTFEVKRVAILNTLRDGLLRGENSGSIIYDRRVNKFRVWLPSWNSWTDDGTVNILYYETQENLLTEGVHILRNGSLVSIPGTTDGNYDPDVKWIASQNLYYMGFGIKNIHAALASSPDGLTWTLIGTDTSLSSEGIKVRKFNNTWYVLGAIYSRSGTFGYDVYSIPSFSYLGYCAVDSQGNASPPHPNIMYIQQDGTTDYLLMQNDGSTYYNGSFTNGAVLIQKGSSSSSGYEFERLEIK